MASDLGLHNWSIFHKKHARLILIYGLYKHDWVVFLSLLEQSKKFRQMFKNDPTGATAMAFDEVIKMDDQPNKYLRLLDSLTEAGEIRLHMSSPLLVRND